MKVLKVGSSGLQVQFGPVGKPLASSGLRAVDNPKLAHNAVFRAGRRLAQTLIGGETLHRAISAHRASLEPSAHTAS